MGAGAFSHCDDLGPAKVVELHQPAVGLRALLVIDNVAAGPSIGGVRMAPEISVEECFRLARAMTLKNAMAGLAHGGGKAMIAGDPHGEPGRKRQLVRAFAQAIAELGDYIPGPDMGTDETCMGWVRDEIGRAVGLPPELGGIPLDELGATGWGLAASARVAAPLCGLELAGARVAIQGFGAVGRHAARFLAEAGARLVAVSDSRGAVRDESGLDLEALGRLKAEGRSVSELDPARAIERDSLVAVPCEIWIPAAGPDVIRSDNVEQLQARLVLQGANIPATETAEQRLHERGVLVVPDFVANAGGVICAAVEHRGLGRAQAFQEISERVGANTAAVLAAARDAAVPPRQAARQLAEARVRRAMALGRWSGAA
ncbi:glutamate dehydrogenase (NADP) [Tistlia consotensis]|uniref:Glutamate dehydrogenase n=1 Tax=Tistlia consotensis USBA 355 TaxID=560819 RepID=A0A1Y6CD34_9PROT|nr:Glu/Leu/Phe/Val dehydrogenase [Tistlia consotensis]SMF48483.1 glutamate dehydrogenase (NADP) [Tistlia consotensis USBA 355]SNR81157.1 glutamate dehydrogenase (NADP) [Tistlia consotensis]